MSLSYIQLCNASLLDKSKKFNHYYSVIHDLPTSATLLFSTSPNPPAHPKPQCPILYTDLRFFETPSYVWGLDIHIWSLCLES